mgnify:FL=1
MKESKLQHTKALDDLKNKVWDLFDLMRGESIRTDEYSVILYFLILYKEIGLKKIIESKSESLISKIQELSYSKENKNHETLTRLFEIFEPTIAQISDNGIQEIIRHITSFDFELIIQNISEIYDDVIYQLADIQGKSSGEFVQPRELSQLICKLINLSDNADVYNPFAGVASFGIFFGPKINYFGQEINQKTWALGLMRMLAYDRKDISNFHHSDSITNWNPNNEKYDLIIAHPPLNLKLKKQIKGKFGYYKTGEQFLIEKGIKDLKDNGNLIVVIPHGFLFRFGYYFKLRKFLINNDLLDTLISLPSGLLSNTGISIDIIIISKNKTHKGKVRFINAENFVEHISPYKRKLKAYNLYSIINENKEHNSIKLVSIKKIEELNFNLNVSRYFVKDYNGIPLENLISTVKGEKKFDETEGKFIRIRDLSDDKLNAILDLQNIEDDKIRKGARKITQSCLLVAARWKTIKPTYFNYTNEPIFISQDILAFKVDDSKIDPYFLINELHADYIQQQLEGYRLGTTIPYVRKADFLKVKINIPNLNEQRAKVAGLNEITSKIESLKEERDKLVHDTAKKQFDEEASLKHTLGRPRQNILSYAEALKDFFESNNSEAVREVNEEFKQIIGQNLSDVFNQIKEDINFISELLERGEIGLNLKDYTLKIINLKEVNKSFKAINDSSFNFTFNVFSFENNEDISHQGILCNTTLLKILINNILNNAHRYGFDKPDSKNEVIADLNVLDDYLILDIKNNGKPFPNNFNKEKFITKYSTGDPKNGTGLGGYDINRIIEYFDGIWDLLLNKDKIYPVWYKIQFPIKPVK